MWRGLFFLGGLFVLVQGTVCLGVDGLSLNAWAAEQLPQLRPDSRGLVPVPAWLAPTLLATGGVTLLYAVALPAKSAK